MVRRRACSNTQARDSSLYYTVFIPADLISPVCGQTKAYSHDQKQVASRNREVPIKEKKVQAPEFIHGESRKNYFETLSARNNNSLLQAPSFSYGVLILNA